MKSEQIQQKSKLSEENSGDFTTAEDLSSDGGNQYLDWLNEPNDENEDSFYFPMSFAQQRLWLINQLGQGGNAYNIISALRLKGNLNSALLEKSIHKIIARHEILRSVFEVYENEPSQLVQPFGRFIRRFKLERRELPPVAEQQQQELIIELAAKLKTFNFDLQQGPLLKIVLVKLSAQETILISVVHHIIADGWSMGVFMRELTTIYQAGLNSQKGVSSIHAQLPELEIQYGDYALWQNEWFNGHIQEQQLSYWREKLAALPPLLPFPTDMLRPAQQSFAGDMYSLSLSPQLSERLKRLAEQHGVTLYMLLLSLYLVLLHRYSAEQDIAVGTPIANRNRHELEAMIGFFVNTLVIRVQCHPSDSFSQLLAEVKSTCLEAFEHQDCPFEQIVDAIQPERTLSYSPLFQFFFSYQHIELESFSLPEVEVSQIPLSHSSAQFDLSLLVNQTADEISLNFEYCTDLFSPRGIARLAEHFICIAETVTSQPQQKLAAIALMQQSQWQNIVEEWNPTVPMALELSDNPQPGVLERIEQQALKTPENIAISSHDKVLTYTELWQQSNHFAAQLLNRGVKLGDLVGLCCRPGVNTMTAILGILKAGAAYVPLDPGYPKERLQLMVKTAELKWIVMDNQAENPFASLASQSFSISELLLEPELPMLLPDITPGLPIYMIFTSGSTGVPKGALVQHQGFANLVDWYCEDFQLAQSNRYIENSSCSASTLIISSLSFDLTQKNLYAPLCFGGTLHFYSELNYDPAMIAGLIERHKISWINCTPSAFYPIAEAAQHSSPVLMSSLRYIFLGGEPISFSRLNWLQQVPGPVQVVNTYGPTECTDVCAFYPIQEPSQYVQKIVPIGYAIDAARLYVLDESLNPLPEGVPGELCIGGIGVGDGYKNDPRRSSERFMPDPFSAKPGARLYRSGDRVCFRQGAFEFLGRIDHEVKLRGFRINLAEIELSLNAHQDVSESIVIVQGEKTQHSGMQAPTQVLSAYYTLSNPGQDLDWLVLREYLTQRLPHYMVPQIGISMTEMPLTPSGKIDRKAMPLIDVDFLGQGNKPLVLPHNPTEEQILEIWQQVLECEQISVEESFFELGGHSLNATQLVLRIRQVFAVDMPMRTIFERPSIVQLSDWILEAQLSAYAEDIDEELLLQELNAISELDT